MTAKVEATSPGVVSLSVSQTTHVCGILDSLAGYADIEHHTLGESNRPYQTEVGSHMTDIDPKSDIELHTINEHVIVRVPPAGPVTEQWLGCYQRLAHATGVPVQAQAHPERTWIVVNVPASGNPKEVAATLDAARALIPEADAAERAPAAAQA